MPDRHAIMLLDVAPEIVESFKGPSVSNLIDPAVWVEADEGGCTAMIVDLKDLVDLMAAVQPTQGRSIAELPSEGAPIIALVVDRIGETVGATTYSVPDPRKHPDCWPWQGDLDDE